MNEADLRLRADDERLLAALRRHIETDGNRLTGPTGEAIDELEVEGLAVLMKEWVEKAFAVAPEIREEHAQIRARIDAFAEVARIGGLI